MKGTTSKSDNNDCTYNTSCTAYTCFAGTATYTPRNSHSLPTRRSSDLDDTCVAGTATYTNDDTNTPPSDNDACTTDTCSGGVIVNTDISNTCNDNNA